MIEGAKLTVCSRCAKHGKFVREERKSSTPFPRKRTPIKPSTLKPKGRNIQPLPVESTLELIEDFHIKIREARETQRLSHEDLGKKTNEKVSVLKKLETGKMTPDNKLATKLEHVLKVKLLISASEKKVPITKIPKVPSRKLTLGDLIKLDDEEQGEKT